MTNKEAIEVLRSMKSDFPLPKAAQTRRAQNDALDAAIKALKAESCDDAISRKAAIDAFEDTTYTKNEIRRRITELPPVHPTIYGYNVEHLELIARILQKENMSPERVVDVLTDIGGIVAIIRDEFEEALRKAVEQCTI